MGSLAHSSEYTSTNETGLGTFDGAHDASLFATNNDPRGNIHLLKNENLDLKRTLNAQSDEQKRLSTKLSKLKEDLKRARGETASAGNKCKVPTDVYVLPFKKSATTYTPCPGRKVQSRPRGLGVETEELVDDLRRQIGELNKSNSGLKNKLTYMKSLQEAQSRKRTPYDHIGSRIETGVPTTRRLVNASSLRGGGGMGRFGAPGGHSQSRARLDHEEIRKLEELVNMLREKLIHSEEEQQRFAEEVCRLKEGAQSETLKTDIEHISLQRDAADKAQQLKELQFKYDRSVEALERWTAIEEERNRTVKELGEEIKKERLKTVELQTQNQDNLNLTTKLKELESIISDLRAEKSLLESEQSRLVDAAFKPSLSSDDGLSKEEADTLREALRQIKTEREAWLLEKRDLLFNLNTTHESWKALQRETQDLATQYRSSSDEHKVLQDILVYFRKPDGSFDRAMLEEATALFKLHRQKDIGLDFLLNIEETYKDKSLLQQLRVEQAECVQELEKIRTMLLIQEKINQDYKREVGQLKTRLAEQANDYEKSIEDSSHLLDVRATKIAKLEAQLKEIAYGTHTVVSNAKHNALDQDDVVLESGQNLVEITLTAGNLNPECVRLLKASSTQPDESQWITFLTFDFFDFETHISSFGLGIRPKWNHKALFKVFADDFFLWFCEHRTLEIRLAHCCGVEWDVVGKCVLSLKEITDSTFSGRTDYVVNLVDEREKTTILGTVDLSLGLRLPMHQVVRAYKDRAAAIVGL